MSPSEPVPTDEVLVRFEQHLLRTRGAVPEVCRNYAAHARMFLEHKHEKRGTGLAGIRAEDLVEFVAASADRYKPKTVQLIVTAVRAFLRFLRMEGLIEGHLEDGVPTVPCRRFEALPRHLGEQELSSLLESLDTSSPLGLRDRAILLCLARLGIRGSEVTALRLEDIDWGQGILRLRRRKTGRGAVLPLPMDVGQALVSYLRRGRPQTKSRHVFVLHRSRVGEPAYRGLAGDAVRRAILRAGIDAPMRGANLLRHTLGTHLINRGASLKDISDLFGHRSLNTTTIYARVDIPSLRDVALPWPEATP